jgi:hypothetical protein
MTVLTSLTGTQNYFDNDGLLRRYGTDKTVPGLGGEFRMPGELRELEFMIDISKLTTTAQIIEEQVYLPKSVWIEKVVVDVQVAAATITSLSVGTVLSSTRDSADATDAGIISAEVLAHLTLNNQITYPGFEPVSAAASTHGGSLIGTATSSSNAPAYFTAKIAGSAGTGLLKVRVFYRSSTVTTQ